MRAGLRAVLSSSEAIDVVGEAADGSHGIVLAETLKPDVVVLDLNMPGLDGLQALPRLRGLVPDAKVIILSASGLAARAHELRVAGAHALVDKEMVASGLADVLSELA